MPKPQPWYASLNQPPRSPSNGRNRSAATPNHSDPLDGADSCAGRTDSSAIRTSRKQSIWHTINIPIYPISPANSSIDFAAYAKLLANMQDQVMHDLFYRGSAIAELPPAPTIPHAGIIFGEITAYRGWVVVEDQSGPMLCSLAHHFPWQPGATIEGNLNDIVNKSAFYPIFGGVYAFREHAGLAKEIEEAYCRHWPYISSDGLFQFTWLGFAYGTVKLWGEVIEHERGYRASFAKLISIDGFVGIEDNYLLPNLRERYHV